MQYLRLKRDVKLTCSEFIDFTPTLQSVLKHVGVLDITYSPEFDKFLVFHVGERELPVSEIHSNRMGERGYGFYCGWSVRYAMGIYATGYHPGRPGFRNMVSIYHSSAFPYAAGKYVVTKQLGGQLVFGAQHAWEQLELIDSVNKENLERWFSAHSRDYVNLQDFLPSFVRDPITHYCKWSEAWSTYLTKSEMWFDAIEAMNILKNDGKVPEEYMAYNILYPWMLARCR